MSRTTLLTQLNSLKNDAFSVLLVDRTKEKCAINWNIRGKTILNVQEITSIEKSLKAYNSKGFDIYLKPEAGAFFNLVIDDLNEDNLNKLLNFVRIDLLILSSFNNYQAIINLDKTCYTKEQGDFLTKRLNVLYGDKNFSGVNHYFRAVGFFNKKPKNNNERVQIIEFLNVVTVEQSHKNLTDLLNDFQQKTLAFNDFEKIELIALTDNEKDMAIKEIKLEKAFCKKRFPNLDFSAIDFRIVKRLYKKGFSKGQIAQALYELTDCTVRHPSIDDYLNRTVKKAIAEIKI